MAYTFDYLVAHMRCPVCGCVTAADDSTEMTTRLRDEPQLAFLGVGDALPVDPARARANGYLVLREPSPHEEVVLLHTWVCPHCGSPFQWAKVVVRDGVIASIEPTELDRDAIEGAHYIVDDAKLIAAQLIDEPRVFEVDDDTAARVLRERLGHDRAGP